MSFWDTLRISSSALTAQRLRLDVIANNIANAETTRTERGGPYRREEVVFSATDQSNFLPVMVMAQRNAGRPDNQPDLKFTAMSHPNFMPAQATPKFAVAQDTSQLVNTGVHISGVVENTEPGPRVYDPTHPDADAEGYVTYPNVNLVTEMTNMVSATRSYEASLAVVDAARRMALRALDIGRG